MIHIEDLFKCIQTLLWKFQNHILKKIIDELKAEKGVHFDTELTTEDLKRISKKIQRSI